MFIKTEIGKNLIRFSWDGSISGFKGNTLWMGYDVDVSKTPRHLVNLMFGLIASDPISGMGTLVFDEQTPEELRCIRNHVKMNFDSKGCGGLARGYDKYFPQRMSVEVKAKKIVDPEPGEHDGPVLCANGLGKDGLTIASMVKELGFDMRCFFVQGEMSVKVLEERKKTMSRFYKLKSIESNMIKTNFFEVQKRAGFFPYFMAIPLAYHYNSEAILAGISIHLSKTWKDSMTFHSPAESFLSFAYATEASGIRFSSPNRPLSLYGVENLLVHRYGELLKLQRSCMFGFPWCNRCNKCYRHHLWISATGADPASIGLEPPGVDDREFYRKEQLSHQVASSNTVINTLKKFEGKPYQKWIEGASKPVFDLIWRGEDFKRIFQEHFDIYDYDVGDDGSGWVLQPSKWKDLVNEPIRGVI